LNLLADAGKEIAAALIAVQHLLYGPGDIIFGIAKLDIEIRFTCRFQFDEIAEAQGFELIAILNQDIEIRVGHRCLILARRLERYRSNTVLLSSFLFQVGMFERIDELDTDITATGDRELLQQITDTRNQRGEKGMGLRREIAAQEQGLLQLSQVVSGRLGDGVDIALGHVGTKNADRRQPEIGNEKVGDNQTTDQLPPAMATVRGIIRPADSLQTINIEAEKDPHDTEIVI